MVPMSPPLPLYRNRLLLGSDKHVALLPRLGWRNSTRRFFNHDARASASCGKNELFFSAGRLGCLLVQFCQAPLHLDKNTCMPAWLEHTLCVRLGRDCTRWARLLRHRGKHFPSLSPNPHCQDSEQHAPASAAILFPFGCQCPLAA